MLMRLSMKRVIYDIMPFSSLLVIPDDPFCVYYPPPVKTRHTCDHFKSLQRKDVWGVFLCFFEGRTCSMWRFPGLGSNQSYSCWPTPHSHTGSLTLWARPGIEPASSWILVRFVNHWAKMGTPKDMFLLSVLTRNPSVVCFCHASGSVSRCYRMLLVCQTEHTATAHREISAFTELIKWERRTQ